MNKRVEFKLSMPNVGSWNGKWSGEKCNYVIYKTLSKKQINKLFDEKRVNSWYYNFGDGWGADITGKILEKGEKKLKSDGFCGYDWMVESIINKGIIERK